MNTDATRAHIDAETMAAWADHGLSAHAAAAVELHLSNCDRCQEVLAAFVRSAPMAGAVVLPFWARRPVRWSAAGLAAAAAIVAMVWIGRPPAMSTPETTVASSEVARDKSAAVDELRTSQPAAQRPLSSPPPQAPPSSAKASKQVDQKKESVPAKPAVVSEPPLAPAAAMPPPPRPAATMPTTVSAPVTVGAAAANAQIAGRAESMFDAFSAVMPVIEIIAPEPSPAASRSAIGGAGRGGSGARMDLAQPIRARWRIVGGVHVERSLDAGTTWAELPIEPALTTPLRAGVATSQFNCWLVGRAGVVLVTTDGLTFRRVSLPESVQLTAVTATDALRAIVTTVDGRTFSTIDGGLTWK